MMRLSMVCLFGFAANCLVSSRCWAEKSTPSVDSVTAKWEEASQKCRSLDAKLTIYRYDDPWDNQRAVVEQGRFYYEAPNLGRIQYGERAATATNDWLGVTQAIVWKGKESLHIDGRARTCARFVAQDSQCIQSTASESGGFFADFFRRLFWMMEIPQHHLPLVVDVHAADLKRRFDVTLDRVTEKEIHLTATPKHPSERLVFKQINIILDANACLANAVQLTYCGGNRIVYVLQQPRLNQRPADWEPLMNPDLSGLTVSDFSPVRAK